MEAGKPGSDVLAHLEVSEADLEKFVDAVKDLV